ncbi:hypothetical protein GCM10029976_085510 [Kribbella albertanoniae]|uniref:Uncharacterized protein n=1 Tax=Kribbella albertanoniae TaxID=1266829 RepID=A0A4R4P0F3_9ACTN|nr:hypothetical protein [Kribbella albertanoniae]TDC15681.1 hypothetical protein E1261_40160 [Kribbella albertanoniae]
MATEPLPPVGSAERQERQRIGEALLFDDGKVTTTPQAKTVAIEALAARMRSSTPELVLASMGLTVGNDMASRLGDSRYVLLAHNERYPSLGADVLHVDELRSAQHREQAHRAIRMDTERADQVVRMISTSELMGAWSYGSNNNIRVLALQEVTRDEFGLQDAMDWHMDPTTRSKVDLELDYNRDALRDFLRTQYQMTQETLAARGITEVYSYRALSWEEGAPRPDWVDENNIGSVIEARQRPLASWSADRQVVADWLEERRGHGVILAARHSTQDIFSVPTTGMGYLGQKEWVTLPGDHTATVDGVISHLGVGDREQSAAAGIRLGGPALDGITAGTTTQRQAAALSWQLSPLVLPQTGPDALDQRIARILDGAEEGPSWWPRDDSGYAIARRDIEFLQISPQQVRWMMTGESPLGLTPELYREFGSEMLEALERDGVDASQVDIRLKGTGAEFYSGLHKTLPTEAELAGNPEALQRMQDWFGDDQNRPLRRPYDSMYRLGLAPEPSDFDLDINSSAAVRAARSHWRENHNDRYPGDFMGGHGYLDNQAVRGSLPNLSDWSKRWEDKLGRPLSLGVFESSGPFDATVLGRELSSHFKDTDWVIHHPQTPMAWNTPQSRMVEPAITSTPTTGPQTGASAVPALGEASERPDHLRRGTTGAARGRAGGRG